MVSKVILIFCLAALPILYSVVNKYNKRIVTDNLSITKKYGLPSLFGVLVSFFTNDRNARRLLRIYLLAVVLTSCSALIYVVVDSVKQNGIGVKMERIKRERGDFLGSSKPKEEFITSEGLHDVFGYRSKVCQWKRKHCDFDNDFANVSESMETQGCHTKNTYETEKLPWYLEFRDTTQTVTPAVYPCTLRRYLDELLQNNPENDLMKYEWARIRSFDQFPRESSARPIRLAQTGFYYEGVKDNVTCFSCKLEYGDWKEEDVPSEIHKQYSPQCRFLTGEDNSNVPIHESRRPVNTIESQPCREAERGATASSTDSGYSSCDSMRSLPVNVKQQSLLPEKEDYSYRKEGAKHPDYADVNRRFESFKDWPCGHLISPKSLVEAGFVYAGFGDCVRCFFCAIGLRNWEKGDDPWAEHARWSQKCSYVLEKKGFAFVKSHQNETDEPYNAEASASAPPLKYDKEENCRRQEIGNQVSRKKDDVQQAISAEKDNKTNPKVGFRKPKTQLNQDPKSVKEENRQLKSQLTCRVCMDRNNNTVFLPCGHLVTCDVCSINLTKCPICRTKVQGRIKAFVG